MLTPVFERGIPLFTLLAMRTLSPCSERVNAALPLSLFFCHVLLFSPLFCFKLLPGFLSLLFRANPERVPQEKSVYCLRYVRFMVTFWCRVASLKGVRLLGDEVAGTKS